jgi:hypothetical protein
MNIRLLRAGPFAGLCLALVLLSGACDNPSGGGDDDDTTITAATAAQNAADQFYADHSAVLAKPADTLILDDETPVDAALEAYNSLQTDVKKLLAEEKAHLDILKIKLDGMKGAAENGVFYTLADLLAYLMEQPDNTADTPHGVTYHGTDTAVALYKALGAAGKYVALDLSKSGVYGFVLGMEEGRGLIVSLILPDTLTETPDGTANETIFAGFDSLTMVSAAGLTSLGEYTFYKFTALTTVRLPQAVSIGASAFADCTSLTTASVPEAVSIGSAAFRRTRLIAASMPKVVSIGSSAFRYSGVQSVTLPEVVSIGDYAFSDCTSLARVTLAKAETIGSYAFSGCPKLGTGSVKVVQMAQASSIGTFAFQNCIGLSTITLAKAETIGFFGFSGCTSLTTVTLPKAASIGNTAFQDCTALTTVTVGVLPPTVGTRIFQGVAAAAKTVTVKAPQLTLYTPITPWSDKLGTNSSVSNYWDNNTATRDKLTVALAAL